MNKLTILRGYIRGKIAQYSVLGSLSALYVSTKSTAVMIAPDVFLRPSIAFAYIACTVLPYPFIWLFPILAAATSTHPLQTFISASVGVNVAFFLSRVLKWRKSETASRVTSMVVATYMAQLATAGFKSAMGIMPFFTYLPLGAVKASYAAISIAVLGVSILWLLQYVGIVNFGGAGEGLRFPRRIPQLGRGLQAWFISNKRK